MYWIFKQDGYDEAFFKALSDISAKQTIVIRQKREFGGEIGDKIVILTFDKESWTFAAYGEISEISKGEPDIEEKVETTIIFVMENRLQEPNQLDDYAYTLLRVRDFENPIKQFRRVYGKITKEEYDAIVSGYIFIARTVFGKFVNAMHRDHRIAFVKYLIDENPNLFFNEHDYYEAYALLNTYMQERIFQHVKYLQDTYRMLQDIAENDANTIGFAGSVDGRVDIISTHAAITMQTDQLNILQQKGYIDETLGRYLAGQSSEEKRFNELFQKFPLPILI